MTALHEPSSLPAGCSDWNEWREAYEAHKADYIAREIDDTRARALLAVLNFRSAEIEAELEHWKSERRAALAPYEAGKL